MDKIPLILPPAGDDRSSPQAMDEQPSTPSSSDDSSPPQSPNSTAAANLLIDMSQQTSLSPVPAIYRSPFSYRSFCALFGCSVSLGHSLSPQYCCLEHENMSKHFSGFSSAFHCYDGFRDDHHRDISCSAALTLQENGIATGIPSLSNVFSALPWEQENVFRTSDIRSTKRNWLFFHDPPESPRIGTTELAWIASSYDVISFDGKDLNVTTLSLSSRDKKKKKAKRAKGGSWVLYLYQYSQVSLYCLSYSPEGYAERNLWKRSLDKRPRQDKHKDMDTHGNDMELDFSQVTIS